MELFIIIFIAFIIAVLFSILGLGGAIIYTPLFFWLGIPLLIAIPMALLLNVITTFSASLTYLKQRMVDTRIAFPMILTASTGALTGSYLAHRMDAKYIILLLSIVLFTAAMRLFFFSNIGFSVGKNGKEKMLIGTGAAFFVGIISSMSGIGGGTFMVPLLLIMGFEMKKAIPTSAFIITFMSFSGFIGYVGFGQKTLDFTLLLYAGAAAFIGAQVGSKVIFRRASSRTIELLFAVVLLFVVGKLLYGLM